MNIYYSADGTSWTQFTGIKEFPSIISRLNSIGTCVFSLQDSEASLFSTWNAKDYYQVKIEDTDANVLFRGYIIKKTFSAKGLEFECRGIGFLLEVTPFRKNYILKEGLVGSVPSSKDITLLTMNLVPSANETIQLHKSNLGVDDYTLIDDTSTEGGDEDDDSTYIYADESDDGEYSSFEFPDDDDDLVTQVTAITIHSYARNNATVGAGVEAYVTVSWNGGVDWEADKTLTLGTSYAWRQSVYSGLTKTQAQLNNMVVRFKANAAIGAGGEQRCSALFVTVTFTGKNIYHLGLVEDDEEAFGADVPQNDYWINDQDVGLLIVDNTNDLSSVSWTASAVNLTHGDYQSGDKDSLDAANDDDTYYFKGDGANTTHTFTPTMDGTVIADSNTLEKIVINYNFGIALLNARFSLQIEYNGASWYTLFTKERGGFADNATWYKSSKTIDADDDELQKYLTKDGTDYAEITNIRIYIESLSGNVSTSNIFYLDKLTIDIYYYAAEISPIMKQITDSYGDGTDYWVDCNSYDWTDSGVAVGDGFKIGQNTTQILHDLGVEAGIQILINSTLSKYVARWYKGSFCIDALKGICQLEDLFWWEDYTNNRIVLSTETDMADSGVDLTAASHDHDWVYEDECNDYKLVELYGAAAYNIYVFKEDLTSTSPRVKQIIDETITTMGDAQEVVDAQFARLNSKRPSIRFTLNGTQSAITVGKTVDITFEQPDGTDLVADAAYPIRRLDRSRRGIDGIATVIYAGLGESPEEESMATLLQEIGYAARKAHSDRLITSTLAAGSSIQWSDVGGADAGARSACIAQTVTNGITATAPSQDAVYDYCQSLHKYVERSGIADWDFDEDGNEFSGIGDVADTWYDLDLSGIIDSGASAVYCTINIKDNAGGTQMQWRKNGDTQAFDPIFTDCQVANQGYKTGFIVGVDSSGIMEFKSVGQKPSDWTKLEFKVEGWWVPV